MTYDLRCQSDSIRMTRHCRVGGIMFCPVNESKLAIILSDSRLIFWDLQTVDYQVSMLCLSGFGRTSQDNLYDSHKSEECI